MTVHCPTLDDMLEPEPIKIDPRPCELCGRTIDQHQRVDGGEGPEFFCYPDDDIVMLWELADPRDAWRHTGETPSPASVRNSDISPGRADNPRPYRTPQSTIDAFFFVAALGNADHLLRWLAQHPLDAPYLRKIWSANAHA